MGLVEVDATAERKLAHRFEVRAFPEILVHRRDLGTFAKYGGPRTADGIVAYMRARLGPACAPLSGASADWMALSEPSGEKGVMLLHIYAQPAAADEAHTVSLDQLERAAENVRLHVRCGTPAGEPLQLEARVRVSFARSFSRALAVTESGTVPPVVHYSGPDDSAQILRWITLHSRPAAGELNEQSARAYVGMRDTGVAVLLLPNPLAGRLAVQKEYYAQQLTAVAEAVSVLAGPPVFLAFCHTQGRIGQQLAADYPVDPAVPTLLLLDFTQRARKPAGYKLVRRPAHSMCPTRCALCRPSPLTSSAAVPRFVVCVPVCAAGGAVRGARGRGAHRPVQGWQAEQSSLGARDTQPLLRVALHPDLAPHRRGRSWYSRGVRCADRRVDVARPQDGGSRRSAEGGARRRACRRRQRRDQEGQVAARSVLLYCSLTLYCRALRRAHITLDRCRDAKRYSAA